MKEISLPNNKSLIIIPFHFSKKSDANFNSINFKGSFYNLGLLSEINDDIIKGFIDCRKGFIDLIKLNMDCKLFSSPPVRMVPYKSKGCYTENDNIRLSQYQKDMRNYQSLPDDILIFLSY